MKLQTCGLTGPVWLVLVLVGCILCASAQTTDPLVEEGVQLRIDQLELSHLRKTSQIDSAQYQARDRAIQQREREYRKKTSAIGRDAARELKQQTDNRFSLIFPPIKSKWDAEAMRLRNETDAVNAQRTKELEQDINDAARIQADRTFRLRNSGTNTSGGNNEADGSGDLAKVEALQKKYTGYGGSWVTTFNRRVQQATQKLVAERDLKERVSDETSEIGADAKKATELTLAMKRNQTRRASGVLTRDQESVENAPLQDELKKITSKYAAEGPLAASARDFNQRFDALVSEGVKEGSPRWRTEAKAEYASMKGRTPSQQQTPLVDLSLLDQLPTTNRVLEDIRGTDELDTRARQRGAFFQLMNIVRVLSDNEYHQRKLSAKEEELLAAYFSAKNSLVPAKTDESQTEETINKRWSELTRRYESDGDLREEISRRYLTPEISSKMAEIKLQQAERQVEYERRQELQRAKAAQEKREETISRWIPALKVFGPLLYLGVFYVAAKFAFGGKLEIVEDDRPMLLSNGNKYPVHSMTAFVEYQGKENITKTVVSGGGYNNRPVSSYTVTTHRREVIIKLASGEKREVVLLGDLALVAMKEGDVLSLVWAKMKPGNFGDYYFLVNHDTGVNCADGPASRDVAAPFSARELPLIFVSCLSCFVGLPLYFIVKKYLARNRANTLAEKTRKQILPKLEEEASKLKAVAGS